MASILADKRPELMLEALSVLGSTLVATQSTNARVVPAGELAEIAGRYFGASRRSPIRGRARELALGRGDAVLVTGSLYLLAELHGHR